MIVAAGHANTLDALVRHCFGMLVISRHASHLASLSFLLSQ